LEHLFLFGNQISELDFTGAGFDALEYCDSFPPDGFCIDSAEVTRLILDDAELSLGSYNAIVRETTSITAVSIDGLTFTDEYPANLNGLLEIETLENVDVDATLYGLYAGEFDAFDSISGNTLNIASTDCNGDAIDNILDANCLPDHSLDRFLDHFGTLRGDLDGVRGVQFADFLTFSGNFGLMPAVYTDGDFDKDGEVGFGDFLLLSDNFGQGADFSGELAVVPEPSSVVFLLAGAGSMLTRRSGNARS